MVVLATSSSIRDIGAAIFWCFMPSFRYRQIAFKIEIIDADRWRWTILPPRAGDLTVIGQIAGTMDQAASYCQAQIDQMLVGRPIIKEG
jgi:hypothetical protein